MIRRSTHVLSALLCGITTALVAAPPASGQLAPPPEKFSLDLVDVPSLDRRQMNRWQRDSTLVFDEDGVFTLAPVSYIINDTGNYIGWMKVDGQTVARKRFTLDRTGAKGADIYVYMGNGEASINGNALKFEPISHGMGGWSQANVPAEWLAEGENVITFTNGFRFGYDTDKGEAKFSDVSTDGGETWQPAKGELLVHVRVAGHPAKGTLTSPVFDFGNPYEHKYISPQLKSVAYHLLYDAVAPEGTSIDVEVRGGDSPILTTAWRPLLEGFQAMDQNKLSVEGGAISHTPRFVQVRLTLKSTSYDKTPTLASALLRGQVAVLSDPSRDSLGVTAMENNDPLIIPSQAFTFQTQSPKLKQLREQFKLDDVVAAGTTEMEKFVLLRNWVRRQWPHNDNGAGTRTWDAIEILSAPAGQKGMCVHYGVTYTQCAVALGYQARQIILNGHYVSEIWSNEHQKWVLMDVETVNKEGWNRYGSAMYIDDRTGVPMSGKDLFNAVHSGNVSDITQELYMTTLPPDGKEATEPIGEHVKYARKYDAAGFKPFTHIGYPDRNNYLDQLDPWEKAHGFDHYHSNSYMWWSDKPAGHTVEYSGVTMRDGDLDWTVNRAHVRLGATGNTTNLRTTIETFTPNIASINYRTGGKGEWKSLPIEGDGPHRVTSMNWALETGGNILEVQPVTTFGTKGIVTRVEVLRK